jgi:hypothetical protein
MPIAPQNLLKFRAIDNFHCSTTLLFLITARVLILPDVALRENADRSPLTPSLDREHLLSNLVLVPAPLNLLKYS